MARRATGAVGGPWGRRAAIRPAGWWTPARVLLALTTFTLLLAFAQKAPCVTGDWPGYKQYTHACYSDVVPLWSDERLDLGAVPYRDTAVEYPVLTGGFMEITALMTQAVHVVKSDWPEVTVFAVLTAILLAICGLVVTASTAYTSRGRPYDAALFALSPLLVFHAFSNWDLLAMALASAALWTWSLRRPVATGVLLGLGTAAKLYPALLLLPLLVLAARSRRWAPAIWAVAAAALTWLAVNVPIALAYYRGWQEFYAFSFQRPTERSTLWAIGKTLMTTGPNAGDAAYWVPPGIAVAVVLVLALGVVAWLGLAAPTRPRVGQLAFLAVLAFLVTTKVWSPQYSLWLVPLLALARPRWRLALAWQGAEILVWILTLTLLLGLEPNQSAHGIHYGTLVVVLLVRDALLLALAGQVIREMWRPELDVVRAGGVDDPAGGFFDAAPDRFVLPLPRLPRPADLAEADAGAGADADLPDD
jgi:uncharacterized membrane protein